MLVTPGNGIMFLASMTFLAIGLVGWLSFPKRDRSAKLWMLAFVIAGFAPLLGAVLSGPGAGARRHCRRHTNPRLNTDLNGFIDWSLNADEVERFICAFDSPYKGASTFLNGKRVFLKRVSTSAQDGRFHTFQNGLIYRKSKDWVCIALKGATLIVEEMCSEDGKNILKDLKVGDRLYTPQSFLENAIDRVIYTPTGLKSI